MSDKHSDLPSLESTSTAANEQPLRPDGMCLHPMAALDTNGQSRVASGERTTSTNSTQEHTIDNNHVSASAGETGEWASHLSLPHGHASDGSLNETTPQNEVDGCVAHETSQEEKSPLKPNEEGEMKDRKETSGEVFASEPEEQRGTSETKKSSEIYEIPLTIMPSEASRKKKKGTIEGQTNGRWTQEEHEAFLEGLKVFGREWKKVAHRIPTRTSAQIRSHAQKYFSKISREDTMMIQGAPAPVGSQQPVSIDELPSSVQRNVERILANPTSMQAEVENTLRQLRERYRQLQIRLEESHRRGLPPLERIVEDGESDDGRAGMFREDIDRRKRSFEDSSIASGYQNDDASSVSELSASFASLSPKRELDDEELIALHVLGGTLPRSASGTELQLGAHSRSSSFSDGDDSETKRRKFAKSNDQGEPDRDHDGDHIL
jgi:SHAQKYF class myb-like DNA-binding protein